VRTRDGANQTNTTTEANIVVDRQAPEGSWATAGIPRNPAPPTFEIQIEAIDQGPYKSGVRGVLCALVQQGHTVDSAFQEQADSPVLLPMAGHWENPAFWYLCALPVSIRNMPSGQFRFSARPVDHAGNIGPTLSTNVTVVSSLAPDAALSKGGESRSMKTWVLVLLVAGGILVCAAAAAIAIWASRRRRRSPVDSRRAAPHASQIRGRGLTVIHLPESPERSQAVRDELAKQDELRMNRALEMSMLEAGVRASRAQQRNDNALELAIQASLRETSPR